MVGYDVVIGEVTDQIGLLSVNGMDAVEYVPGRVLVAWERGVEQVCTVAFKIRRSSFPYLMGRLVWMSRNSCSE